jgi:TRAP-type mannitol/chloroaromatic compound transport system permease small subunit
MVHRIIAAVNRLNEAMGQFTKWLMALVVAIVTFDVFMRYVLNSPTLWGYDLTYMVGCGFYTLGLGYAQKHGANIRVDLWYSKFPPRVKVVFDTLTTLFFFLPTYILLTQKLWENALHSLASGEKATTSTWYPYLAPVKLCLAAGFSLFVLQLASDVLQGIFKLRTESGHGQEKVDTLNERP